MQIPIIECDEKQQITVKIVNFSPKSLWFERKSVILQSFSKKLGESRATALNHNIKETI